jgi:hypothetical protein
MRQRGASTVGAVLLAAAAGMVTAAALADWMVVDVQTRGEDAVHLVIPFPLLLGDIAAAFVPEEALAEAEIPPEARAQREVALAALRSLTEIPDTTLVVVDDGNDHVEIRKEGADLLIRVEADDATVRCAIPIEGVLEALEDWDWQRADPKMLLDILHEARSGEMLYVAADDARVTIKMW